jgi:7,8-dihydropterin-6-yl-methyl-4-(beta-D-ribofuranosyl)aminobenzene 5'-phosphate synthase
MSPHDSPPADVLQLDELEILVVVDNETDTLSSVDAGVPQVPEIIHLASRTPPSRHFEGHECKAVFDQLCCACHGLSVLITGRRDGQPRRMLFDVGPDNARRLDIDLSSIECIFLSHDRACRSPHVSRRRR